MNERNSALTTHNDPTAQIHVFPEQPQITDDQAFALLLACREADTAEQKAEAATQVENFRKRSARHAQAMARAEDDWALMGQIARPDSLAAANSVSGGDTATAAPAGRKNTAQQQQPEQPAARRYMAVAAVLLLAVSLSLLYPLLTQPFFSAQDAGVAAVQRNHITTRAETREHDLPDGSHMVLNWNTEIRTEFTATARHIYLQRGEALFTVAKDATRPFIVHSGEVDTRAVGTEFSVHRKAGRSTHIAVTEGVVAVSDHSAPARHGISQSQQQLLRANESIEVSAGQPGHIRPVSTDEITAWTKGMLVFRDTPLTDVLSEIERYSHYHFVTDYLPDPDAGVTATYYLNHTDKALVSLLDLFHLQADIEAGRYATRVELRPARPRP